MFRPHIVHAVNARVDVVVHTSEDGVLMQTWMLSKAIGL